MKKTKQHILLPMVAIVVSLLLTGCYTHRAIGLLQERTDLPQYDSVPYTPYRLQINDEIIYRVISLDENLLEALQVNNQTSGYNNQNTYTYRIFSDGTIDLPFLDPIKIEGLTETEAQDTVQKYMRELIPDAEVKLALSNKQFLVLGDIGTGVRYIYKERMTIYQALAMTGDVLHSGDRRHIRIVRPHGNDKPEILEFDLRTNTLINSQYYYIYPNDLIYVRRDNASYYKQETYPAFIGMITSYLSLLILVLQYIPGVNF